MNRTHCPRCGLPKNFRNSSFGLITRCQNCGKRYFLPDRRRTSGLATCLGGMIVLGFGVVCCGGIGMLGSRSNRDATPNANKEQPAVARAPEAPPKVEPESTRADPKPVANSKPAEPPVEHLAVLPRQLPTLEEERDAADRFRLARAFYNGNNYRTSKEVLVFLLGEYPDTKVAPDARVFLERKELAAINVPPYVRKPRPEVAEGSRKSNAKPEPVYEQPQSSEADGVVFLPSRQYKGGTVNVRGYVRKDGTYVAPYTRHTPRR
jgi:predicted  nucleic acid-binding Zn-ribbon protein